MCMEVSAGDTYKNKEKLGKAFLESKAAAGCILSGRRQNAKKLVWQQQSMKSERRQTWKTTIVSLSLHISHYPVKWWQPQQRRLIFLKKTKRKPKCLHMLKECAGLVSLLCCAFRCSLLYLHKVNWLLFHADQSMSGELKSGRSRAASKRASNTTYGWVWTLYL